MKTIQIIIVILIALPFLLLLFRSFKVQTSANQKIFIKGSLPSPKPNGFYKGKVSSLKTDWKGKIFDASSSSGINLFGSKKRYPFKTYIGNGLLDKNLEVFKIDYNLPQNPLWVRLILDEIVQTENSKYLGKVNLRILPGLSFSLGFFNLEK